MKLDAVKFGTLFWNSVKPKYGHYPVPRHGWRSPEEIYIPACLTWTLSQSQAVLGSPGEQHSSCKFPFASFSHAKTCVTFWQKRATNKEEFQKAAAFLKRSVQLYLRKVTGDRLNGLFFLPRRDTVPLGSVHTPDEVHQQGKFWKIMILTSLCPLV